MSKEFFEIEVNHFLIFITKIPIMACIVLRDESFSVHRVIAAVIITGGVYISDIENSKGEIENADKKRIEKNNIRTEKGTF